MLVELIGLKLRKAADTFWLFSYGLVLLVLGKNCLCIFVCMFLDESFEPHCCFLRFSVLVFAF